MNRVPIIDFVRFASIFVVMGGHFFPRWVANEGYFPFVRQAILDLFLNGAYGVTCFFVVSGFLITQMLAGSHPDFSRIDLKSFYVKRAARIFPLLALTVATGFLLEHLKPFMAEGAQRYNSWDVDSGFNWKFWLSLGSFNFNWFLLSKKSAGVGMHWAILWSLAVEEQFYFCYPLVMKTLRTSRRVLVLLGGVVGFAVLFRIFCFYGLHLDLEWMHIATFAAFDQIAVGCALYFIWERTRSFLAGKALLNLALLALGISLSGGFYLFTSFDNGPQTTLAPTLLAVSCAMTILGGLHISWLNSGWAEMLSWPGKLSYGCYLWHPTLMFLLIPLLGWMGGLRALLFFLVFVWAFAHLSYKYFELPLNNRVRALFGLKPSRSL